MPGFVLGGPSPFTLPLLLLLLAVVMTMVLGVLLLVVLLADFEPARLRSGNGSTPSTDGVSGALLTAISSSSGWKGFGEARVGAMRTRSSPVVVWSSKGVCLGRSMCRACRVCRIRCGGSEERWLFCAVVKGLVWVPRMPVGVVVLAFGGSRFVGVLCGLS